MYERGLEFTDQSEEFARGFEMGRIWTLMQRSPSVLDGQPFHADQCEMVMRMIETTRVQLHATFCSDPKWMIIRLGKHEEIK